MGKIQKVGIELDLAPKRHVVIVASHVDKAAIGMGREDVVGRVLIHWVAFSWFLKRTSATTATHLSINAVVRLCLWFVHIMG